MKTAIVFLFALILLTPVFADETLPKPGTYFTDTTGTISKEDADKFNHELANYERETSNQFLVYMTNEMPDDDYEQLSINTFHAWGIGQAGKDNGVAIFIYLSQHKMFIATGRGLEGAIPDAIASHIIANMRPYFKNGQFTLGIQSGIADIMKAAKGEYAGTGKTVAENKQADDGANGYIVIGCCVILFLAIVVFILIALFGDSEETITDYFGSPSYRRSRRGSAFGTGFGAGALSESPPTSYAPSPPSDTPSYSPPSSDSGGSSNDSFSSGGGDNSGGGAGGGW